MLDLLPFPYAIIAERLLAWYDQNRRVLPWRARPGESSNPYWVWLSEIMLQQTTVTTVKPYFYAFIRRWPTLNDLAQADLSDVLTVWAGLGYYARARNLHKCARLLMMTGEVALPADEKALRRLPGIGTYTAAAIAAIAFGQRTIALDGNIKRVVTRLFAITGPLQATYSHIYAMADAITPTTRCGDFIQASMDLGAMLCTSHRKPVCPSCPLQISCVSCQQNLVELLPAASDKINKKPCQIRHGLAFCAVRNDGTILLYRRQQAGLLGGMMEIPSTPWRPAMPWALEEAVLVAAPLSLSWQLLPGVIQHRFTHFQLELVVAIGQAAAAVNSTARGVWCTPREANKQALPSVMRKIIVHAIYHSSGIFSNHVALKQVGNYGVR